MCDISLLCAWFGTDYSGKNIEAVQALSGQYPDIKIKARKVKYAEDIAENAADPE